MKKQTDKELLFERMHKVSGMPLNENFKQAEEFTPHGTYTVSNSGGYEIMLNDSGDGAKVRDAYDSDNPKTSDWLEIEHVTGEDGELEPVIDPNGYNIPLNQVMRVNEDDDKVTAADDSEPEETEAWQGGISVDEDDINEDSSSETPIHKWVMFAFNYPHGFIEEVWADAGESTINHLSSKFSSLYNRVGSSSVINKFYTELDAGNQAKLENWVMENYQG